jgi:hypothetical protein
MRDYLLIVYSWQIHWQMAQLDRGVSCRPGSQGSCLHLLRSLLLLYFLLGFHFIWFLI